MMNLQFFLENTTSLLLSKKESQNAGKMVRFANHTYHSAHRQNNHSRNKRFISALKIAHT